MSLYTACCHPPTKNGMRSVLVVQTSDERVNQTGIASECRAVERDPLHWWNGLRGQQRLMKTNQVHALAYGSIE